MPLKSPLSDEDLELINNAGILIEGNRILSIDKFETLLPLAKEAGAEIHELNGTLCCLPGFVDAHTHICFGGSRARDYALRNSGKTYLEIAREGGGIWDTVTQTRMATEEDLVSGIIKRSERHLKNGTTTLEVKSGYGLSVDEELKMLRAIQHANAELKQDLIATCLAAHTIPREYEGKAEAYLQEVSEVLLPQIKKLKLAGRVDAFIEESAFSSKNIQPYFQKAKALGFDITVHADQFTTSGSEVAVQFGAISADHLEASTDREIDLLAKSDVIATALPGASLGLGCDFTPARKILDAGGALAIASDHNPGSAPMGDLLIQAAVLGSFEKLSNAEVLAGITFRGAAALNLQDRGVIAQGALADLAVFHSSDYRDILYHQGNFKPSMIWKNGVLAFDKHKN